MKPTANDMDKRDLIGEAFRIEGIGAEDCRSIFFDWALGLESGQNPAQAARFLLDFHKAPEGHPMTLLLAQAAEGSHTPRRRGGRLGGTRSDRRRG